VDNGKTNKGFTFRLSDRPRLPVFYLVLASAAAPFCSIAASHALLAASLIGLLLIGVPLRMPPVKLPLFLFIAGTVNSLLLSGHIREGWPQIRKFYVFILVLVCMTTAFTRIRDWLVVLNWWTIAAVSSSVLAIIQLLRNLGRFDPGKDSLYHALVGYRITGFMSLWTTFAGQMMIAVLMLAGLLLFSREGKRNWRYLAPCGALILAGLIFALTRGPWIGAGAGAVYLLWQWKRKSLLALPILAALAFAAAPGAVRERVVSIVQPSSELDSNSHRLVLWRTGIRMVKAHPWFGLGPEQVRKQFTSYLPPGAEQHLPFGWYGHLHNTYLQYAAERGLPVLAIFLWLMVRILRDFRRALRLRPPGLDASKAILHGCIAAILACLVAALFEHNLGDSEMLQLFLTLIPAGYAAAANDASADQPANAVPDIAP
jgi:putative inorganic carbon (hco3(-)) transporter